MRSADAAVAIGLCLRSCLVADVESACDMMLTAPSTSEVKNARTPRSLVAHVLFRNQFELLSLLSLVCECRCAKVKVGIRSAKGVCFGREK